MKFTQEQKTFIEKTIKTQVKKVIRETDLPSYVDFTEKENLKALGDYILAKLNK